VACEQCGASGAEYFRTDGRAVCRVCYYREQTGLQDARAQASLAEGLPDGILPAKNPKPPQPGRVLKTGLAITGFGLALNVALFLLDGLGLAPLAVLGFGVVTTMVGYRSRHYQ